MNGQPWEDSMSFDMFVSAYEEGTDWPVVIPGETYERVFGDRIAARERNFWRVEYPDGSGADIYLEAPLGARAAGGGCMVNHAGGDMFFEALVTFLREAGAVIYWGSGCAIADEAVRSKVPPGLIKACGPLECVSTGRQLMEWIART